MINDVTNVEAGAPDAAELLRRARAMIPTLADRAEDAAQMRRVPARTVAEMQEAGLFRVLQPKRWGGFEMDPGVFFDIQLALAEGCMSTAWIYGVLGAHPFALALFDDRAARDVWGGNRSTLICSSLMPAGKAIPVDGGFRFSGHWKYSSGCDHAEWIYLGGLDPLDSAGSADRWIFLLPRADFTIVDTWRVAGLRATGSQDIVVKDAFVPHHCILKLSEAYTGAGPGQAFNPAPLYRIPFAQVFLHGTSVAPIGALQGMLGGLVALATTRRKVGEDPMVQLVCAETAAAITEMKAIMHGNFARMTACARLGEVPPTVERLQFRFQASFMAERCSLLAARIFKSLGAEALYDDRPFGRMLADINAGRQHHGNAFEANGRGYGATILGLGNSRDRMH